MSELLVGYGDATLTPPLGTALAGYGGKIRLAESVLDDLKAHAIWLEKGADRAVLISCDLIGFAVDFSDAIRRQIASEHGMPMEHVLLSCTHTHSGPGAVPLETAGGAGGLVDPDYLAKVPDYVGGAVRVARMDRSKAILRTQCQTIAPIGINRCCDKFDPIDPELTTAIFDRPHRNKIYVLNYACHPVMTGNTTAVSADWPGRVVHAIERRGHHGAVFQGFCGDINPVNIGTGQDSSELATLHGELMCQQMLSAEPKAESMDVDGIIGLEKRVRIPLQVPDLEGIQKEHDDLSATYENRPEMKQFVGAWLQRARVAINRTDVRNVPVQRVAVGGLNIIGLPGEVFCEYGLRLKAKYPTVFTVGYAGGCIGYLPTIKAYESKRGYAWYGCYSAPKSWPTCFPFAPNLEDLLLGCCDELLGAPA